MSARQIQAKHRRRRFAALLVLVLVVALVVTLLVWRPWESAGGDAQPAASGTATPAPSVVASPQPSQPFTPIGGVPEGDGSSGACTADQIVITPVTDSGSYTTGVPVQMSFEIQNIGSAPCTMNVGTTQQQYIVTTGAQVVFRSADCPLDGVDQVVTLEPGVVQSTVPIAWDRTFSSPETCVTAREPVISGGASYHLAIIVGGIESTETRQFLLY